jgi:tetratricopeptide (TPR) repeat protein
VYPDERVTKLITDNFIPARVHVKENAADFQRFGEKYNAQWTPTILLIGPDADEVYRIEGFLPADDFLAQITLGLGHYAFKRKDFAAAERHFREAVDRYPSTEGAAEALYWAGVSRYKATSDPKALGETATAFRTRYSDSSWAKKASIWGG